MTDPSNGGNLVPELTSEPNTVLPSTARIDQWLSALVARRGSDLLLVSGVPACIRFEGTVQPIGEIPLSGLEIESATLPALTPNALQQYRDHQISDSSYRIAGVGRFRINLHREQGMAAATVRALPNKIPRLEELRLPPSVAALSHLQRGLVLIGGPAGAGKSTTVAAIVNEINQRDARHIITIEDPVEYEHPHVRSVVEKVESGVVAPVFPTALRAALRQAPDIIMVGEM